MWVTRVMWLVRRRRRDEVLTLLHPGPQYIISMPFGGTGNQFLAMMNMLYIAKHTDRVAIM